MLTGLLLLMYIIIILYSAKYEKKAELSNFFLSKDYATVLKGLCCIIVIFVHIPASYRNELQDIVGSFAYICVTLFFMFSAYGLQWSFKLKPRYGDCFLRNRVLTVAFPFVLSMVIKAIFGFDINSGGTKFVYVLLSFYLLTYIVHRLPIRKNGEVIIACGVLIYSFMGYWGGVGPGWYVESLGFLWGIILAENEEVLKRLYKNNYWISVIVLTLVSGGGGVLYLKFKYIEFWGEYALRAVLGIVLVMWVMCITYRVQIGNIFSGFLGKISYEIFLLHGFVMSALVYLDECSETINLSSGLFIVLTIAFSVLLAFIFNKINNLIKQILQNGKV